MFKKSLFSILAAVFGIAVAIAAPLAADALTGSSGYWYLSGGVLKPVVSSWGISVPTLTATTATITGISSGNLLPSTNNTYNLGSAAKSWKDIYASGTLMVGAGAVGAPSMSFGGDTDTGIYNNADGQLSMVSNGGVSLRTTATTNTTYRDLKPSANNSYSLGAFGSAFSNIYSSSTIYGNAAQFSDNVTSTGIIYTGSWTSATDPGSPYPFMRFPLSATPAAGTRNNAIISMGTAYMMGFYGENTGTADSVQNRSVGIYAPRFKVGQMNTTNYMYVGTADGCGALTFSTSSSWPTLTPTSTSFCL